MEEMTPAVWLKVRRGCLIRCVSVAGYLYQLALLDGREGSALMPSSRFSRQVWVKNNICKTVPHGAFPSV